MSAVRRKEAWTVEKRFRVTEVFLAILWVCMCGWERMSSRSAFSIWESCLLLLLLLLLLNTRMKKKKEKKM